MNNKIVIGLTDISQFNALEEISKYFNLGKFIQFKSSILNLLKTQSNLNIKLHSTNEDKLNDLTFSAFDFTNELSITDLQRIKETYEFQFVEFNEPQILHTHASNDEDSILKEYPYNHWNLSKIWQCTKGDQCNIAIIDTDSDYHKYFGPKNILQSQYEKNLSKDIHSTEILSIIGAPVDKKFHIGISPESNLYLYSGAFKQRIGDSDVLARLISQAAYSDNIDIINLSWGPGTVTHIHRAIQLAESKGKIIVCSAGNDNIEIDSKSMASMKETISVGGLYSDNSKHDSSNYGDLVDLWAPSEFCFNLDIKKCSSGTSYSSAMITAFISLLLSYKKSSGIKINKLTKSDILYLLSEKSENVNIFSIKKFLNSLNL